MGGLMTIIYYSSGREKPDFEKRVQTNLRLVAGELPIVSVTQQPCDIGKNICVGDVGVSGFNCFRQVQIACEAARTPFVISAEADCLYPPDYFEFVPERTDACYRNTNLYVMPDARDFFFWKKEGATHAQVVGREVYLATLAELFRGAPQWCTSEKNFPKERWGKADIFDKVEHFRTENPVVQIKTHRGMRYYTHSERIPVPELPYWGSGNRIRQYYLHGLVE